MSQESGRVIALEGLIGVGKSTLVNQIGRSQTGVQVLQEHINPALLALFYANPAKYGFAMQWAALQHRIYQAKLLHLKLEQDTMTDCLWDRSMLGDYAFALWNHLTNNINIEEMEAYETMFQGSAKVDATAKITDSAYVRDIDYYVWLVDLPENCKRRVELRHSDPAEMGIPDQYYQGLEDVHIALFLTILRDPQCQGMVKVRRWDQYSTAKSITELLKWPSLVPSEFTSARYPEEHPMCNPLPILEYLEMQSYPHINAGVAQKYGFRILTTASKTDLYRYLSNGGDPQQIIFE